MAWAENVGWIRLGDGTGGPYHNNSSSDWGVNYDGAGNLSGYAWSENAGWINFDPTHSQVTIGTNTGSFDGYAWGENTGYIHFKNTSPAYNVSTTFSPTVTTGTATGVTTSSGERSNIGTMKTREGGTATVIYTDTTPNAATVARLLSFSSSDATLEFDAYTIGSYAVITHTDAEANEDAEKVDKLLDHAYIKTSSFNQAKVKLVETGVDTGTFKGSIQISSRATLDYERIQASIGGTLTAWCEDGINTTGVLRTVSARSRVVDEDIPTPTPTVTPAAMAEPTVTPVVTPAIQPTPTPFPVACVVEKIKPSPSKLSRLKRNTSDEVTVAVTGEAEITFKAGGKKKAIVVRVVK